MKRSAPRRLAVLVAALAALAAGGCRYSVDLEPIEDADRSSQVLAADGSVLATLDAGTDRRPVPYARIPPALRDAVVAIEDHRFFQHSGVDLRAVARALRRNVAEGGIAEGGSTITQQYVRMVLLGRERTLSRKVHEAILAVQVERRLSKEEILGRYLNTVYFGTGAYGVQAAADRYFAKDVADLTVAESALLAGLVQAPERVNPFVAPRAARRRRDLVLAKMAEYGFLSSADARTARSEPVAVTDAHWRREYPAAHFVEQVKRFVLEHEEFGETADERRRLLFRGGLRIETTLEPRLQMLAQDAVAKVLVDPSRDPQASLVTIDPRTGHVLAYVGGRDFFGDEPAAKFDLAAQARRQAGSAFKPFVLAAALADGVPLARSYDAPSELELPMPGQAPWRVRNYDGEGSGRLNLVDATVASVNTVYAQLVMDVGAQDVVDVATDLGVRAPLDPYPSVALGTGGVSALDMASAYATLAADGLHAEPVFVRRVTGPDGTVLYEESPRRDRALDAEIARQVNAVLEQVVARGTGVNARIGRPVAGKTGTGEEWRDAWFVGSTPELTTAVWVGFADSERSMVPPATRARVTGGLWPAQIWALFSAAALAETPVSEFPAPSATGEIEVKVRPLPDLRGMPGDRAVELLADAGFAVETVGYPSRDYPPGRVLAQDPPAHAAVPEGSTVTVVLASGPPPVTAVPSLLGLLADEAIAAARAAGLDPQVAVEAEPPPGAPGRAGRSWKQIPAAGTEVDRGTAVTLWVNPA